MIGRFVLVLMIVGLLVSLVMTFGLPRPASAQDPLPTPVGQLGGREPLPTDEGLLGGEQPQDTPEPSRHPLVGAWLLTFAAPERAPAQVVFGDDGIVTFIDAVGNRGAGVWIPSGPESGVVAVGLRGADASGGTASITMLQGPITVGTPGDTATLRYTLETVEGSGTTSERSGPFTARGQRVDEQLIVPPPE
jgi:hypothetical protein